MRGPAPIGLSHTCAIIAVGCIVGLLILVYQLKAAFLHSRFTTAAESYYDNQGVMCEQIVLLNIVERNALKFRAIKQINIKLCKERHTRSIHRGYIG